MLPVTSEIEKIYNFNSSLFHLFDETPWAQFLLNELYNHHVESYEQSIRVGFIAGEISCGDSLTTKSALLHDIGKIAIPVEILRHTDRQDWEIKFFDTHPRIGAEIIKPFDKDIAEVIVAHHEFQDRQYPRNNHRLVISRFYNQQRMVALADVTDALLSRRHYKEPWDVDKTRAFLGKKYTKDEVEASIAAFLTIKV